MSNCYVLGLLEIRESGTSTMIPGLSIHKPSGPENILSLLSFGNGNRTQHATDANKESSRSHAVLQVFVKLKDKDAGLSTEVKVAKMSLIDLAGSEKVNDHFPTAKFSSSPVNLLIILIVRVL